MNLDDWLVRHINREVATITLIAAACSFSPLPLPAQDMDLVHIAPSSNSVLITWGTPTNRFIVEQVDLLNHSSLTIATSDGTTTNRMKLELGNQPMAIFRVRGGLSAVLFQDASFEQWIRDRIDSKLDPANRVYDIELAGITNLTIRHEDIVNLTGVAAAENLTELHAGQNELSSAEGIRSLQNLRWIDLTGNRMQQLGNLDRLDNLTTLWLSANQLSTLNGISGLTSLTELRAEANDLDSISALQTLVNLQALNLGQNNLTDLTPLASMVNLQTLYLDGNSLTSLNGLQNLTRLHLLDLSDNHITSLTPLITNAEQGGIGEGDVVYLTGNPEVNQDELTRLRKLGVLVYYP